MTSNINAQLDPIMEEDLAAVYGGTPGDGGGGSLTAADVYSAASNSLYALSAASAGVAALTPPIPNPATLGLKAGAAAISVVTAGLAAYAGAKASEAAAKK